MAWLKVSRSPPLSAGTAAMGAFFGTLFVARAGRAVFFAADAFFVLLFGLLFALDFAMFRLVTGLWRAIVLTRRGKGESSSSPWPWPIPPCVLGTSG